MFLKKIFSVGRESETKEEIKREVNGEEILIETEDSRLADAIAECLRTGEAVLHNYDENGNLIVSEEKK